jgi:cyclase
MRHTPRTLPASEHFQLTELAPGVYAAVGIPGRGAYSNAGIVDLGDRTLIFDTFMTTLAAADLRDAAEQLTGRPAGCIIISHAHSDHWMGNQVFDPQVPILASKATRATMPEAAEWLQYYQEHPDELEDELRNDRARLEAETDPRQRASLEAGIARWTILRDVLPTQEFRLPNLTFEGNLTFHGTERTAELVLVEPGHTASDAYLHLAADRIVFMGDLGFLQCQPFMAYCDPQAWMAQCQVMEGMEVDTFVPGHGPLGTHEDITLQREYIALLLDLLRRVIDGGGTVEDALAEPLPPPFDAWLHGSMARWETNVRTMYDRLADT